MEAKPRTQQPKLKSKAKSNKSKTFEISPFIDGGIWRIIFRFIGINKHLIRCRRVCKKWKTCFDQSIKLFLRETQISLELQAQILQKKLSFYPKNQLGLMHRYMEKALKLKAGYMERIKLIPHKSTLFSKISELSGMRCPAEPLHSAVIAIMYLLTDKEEVIKQKGRLDWKYCQKRLADKNFMKYIQETDPETLPRDRIQRFQAAGGAEIPPEYVAPESTQVMYMLEWAVMVIECREIMDILKVEGKEALKEFARTKEVQKQFNMLSKLAKTQANS